MRTPTSWSLPLGALILIVVGAVLLLQNLGVLPWSLWLALFRFWPVLLIAIGLRIILGRGLLSTLLVTVLLLLAVVGATIVALGRWPGAQPEGFRETLREARGTSERLEAKLRFGAGRLSLRALPVGSADLVVGEFAGGARSSLHRRGATAVLEVTTGPRWWPFWQAGLGGSWELALSQDVPTELEVDAGAADLFLDLTDLQVTRLDLDTGASSVEVRLPARVPSGTVEVNAGAANITLMVPPETAARIRIKGPLSGVTVDRVRFPSRGDVYESEGFATAERRLAINIDAAAASVTVR